MFLPRGHPSFYTLPSEAFLSSSTEPWALGGTLALLYRLKEGDCAQGTRKSVKEISVRITCDILKPQYGFRHSVNFVDENYDEKYSLTTFFP